MKNQNAKLPRQNLHWETQLQHTDPIEVEADNYPLVPPIYQSVKYHAPTFESFGGKPGSRYFYSRLANPTVSHLEKMLARLQGCAAGLALGSGIAAISASLLTFLRSGDHVIFFAESYRPTRGIIVDFLSTLGVTSTMLVMADIIDDPKRYEAAIQPGRTRVVIFESPTNPMTRIAPVEDLVEISKRHSVLTLLDATLAGIHQYKNLGIDLYIHSLTKFAGGHGDVMGGAVLGRAELVEKVRGINCVLGAVLDPQAASMILRGMKTYAIRFREESARALSLAQRLEKHAQVGRVFYPGLESHPDHARLKKMNAKPEPAMADHGSVLSFDLKTTGDDARDRRRMSALINQLDIVCLASSLGSTETLVTPVRIHFGGDLNPPLREKAFIAETTLRVSVGLEDADDMWKQWQDAFAAIEKI